MVQKETREFIDIPGYEGVYMVNSIGQVKSLLSGRILSPNVHYKSGYLSVQLRTSVGKYKRINIHQIMCMTFIDRHYIDKGLVCNHKDGNKQNNTISNLEAVTHTYNCLHAFRTGIRAPSPPSLGEDHGMSKLTAYEAEQIFVCYNYTEITQRSLGDLYNVSRNTVCDIIRGVNWAHVTKQIDL